MELDYEITPADTRAYAEYRNQRSPSAWWSLVVLFGLLFSLGFASGAVNPNVFGLHPLLFGLIEGLVLAAFMGGVCLASVHLPRLVRRFASRRAGHVPSRCHVALDQSAIEYAERDFRVRWDWRALARVIVDKQHIFICATGYACSDSGRAVITVAKAAFESPQHLEAFLARLEELKNSSGKPS